MQYQCVVVLDAQICRIVTVCVLAQYEGNNAQKSECASKEQLKASLFKM